MSNLRLPFDSGSLDARIDERDRASRERAVDPRFNVALEASAGTGKTRVLVDRYVNLLREGVDPANVLAITFTRKAAAEMRERIVATLRAAAARGEIAPSRWRELRDRTADINISTIDAFCLSLLREFPLEADLDPGFDLADETDVPRFVEESLDASMRIFARIAKTDDDVALVLDAAGKDTVEAKKRAAEADVQFRAITEADISRRVYLEEPARAIATAVRAAGIRDMPQTRAALLDALIRDPHLMTYVANPSQSRFEVDALFGELREAPAA